MKISIIIPVYNVSTYLARCLESILNQKAKDYEIICVDDGSTDDSFCILSSYQKRHPEMKVIQQSNQGAAVARNRGMQEAVGEWIAFVDADDYVTDDFFQIVYNSMEEDCDIVLFQCLDLEHGHQSNVKYYDQRQKELLVKTVLMPNLTFLPGLKANLRTPWGKIYHHDFLTKYNLNFADGCISGQDCIFNLYCMNCIRKVKYVEQQMYCYEFCVNPNSLTAGYQGDIHDRVASYFGELDSFVLQNPQFKKEYNLLILNDVFNRLKGYFFHSRHSVAGRKRKAELRDFFLHSRYQTAYKETGIGQCVYFLGIIKTLVLLSIFLADRIWQCSYIDTRKYMRAY